ncbi:helix-turn-helix domain-containing protein [Bacillus sp. SCS-151]|uniref:helix-turn-helix domain-containing protein n=1 Tax=Nanhaiella sioensis TaxID=3115293 RepID=UPI00397C38F6
MKDNVLAISLFSLAICVVIGSLFISNGLKESSRLLADHLQTIDLQSTIQLTENKTNSTEPSTDSSSENQLLTPEQFGDYLGISEDQVNLFLPDSNGDSPIPYVKIGSRVYFPKTAVDKWLVNVETFTISKGDVQ